MLDPEVKEILSSMLTWRNLLDLMIMGSLTLILIWLVAALANM